jgi:hypothetical protein
LFPLSLTSEAFLLFEPLGSPSLKSLAYVVPFGGDKDVSINIGRSAVCEMNLCDSSISRAQSSMSISGRSIILKDEDSKFGTFVELRRDFFGLQQVSIVCYRYVFSFEFGEKEFKLME